MNFVKTKKLSYLFLFSLAVVCISFFLYSNLDKFSDNSAWDKNISSAAGKADAIAVRILENPNHYNPARWYRKQGFKGKPTKLTIDGYRAVRSGRTTYVNVGNVDGSGDLHTYIYLLSYNQNIEPVTKTIYKR